MKYIDTHCQLQFPEFKNDLEDVFKRMEEREVGAIIVGTNLEMSKEAVRIAETRPYLYAIIGLHPIHFDEGFDEAEYEKLISNPKVVGVGECGFDFNHHSFDETFDIQKEIFEKQIRFAIKHNKPLMLHLRNDSANKNSAYSEAIKIIQNNYPKTRGNSHFFAGTLDEAKQFMDMGITLSFTGVITFAKQYAELIKNISLEYIMSETDCPFVAPVPFRGQRAEPVHVIEVVNKIAEIRGEDKDMVREKLLSNAIKYWSLK